MLNTTTHRGVHRVKAEHQVGRRIFRRFYHHCSLKSFNRLLLTHKHSSEGPAARQQKQKPFSFLLTGLLGLVSGALNFRAFADKRPLTWHRIAVF